MKELAAETLMVGNVDLEFEKKSQLICVTKKTHSFPCVLFAFDFIICLYFLAKLSQLTWFCIIYWKATLRGGEVICTLMGHTGGCSICLNVAELSQPIRRSWVNLSMASATVQTPSLQ